MITYREPGKQFEDCDYLPDDHYDRLPNGANGTTGIITTVEPIDSTLYRAVDAFRRRQTGGWARMGELLITHEGWWSGYSEFTVTSTWESVVVTSVKLNWEYRWETVAAMFRDLAEVEDDR